MNILIVDDIDMLRTLLSLMISSIMPNAKVYEAESVRDAITIVDSNPIEYVLSDYDMPGSNGGILFQYLKARHPTIKFVLVSSHHPKDLNEFKGCQEALLGHVTKPFERKDIVALLKTFK